MRELKVGQEIVYIDSRRRKVPALIQCVHGEVYEFQGEMQYPCINLIFVSTDPGKTDQYGRQIEHQTSVNYWKSWGKDWTVGQSWGFPDEEIVIDESKVATQK